MVSKSALFATVFVLVAVALSWPIDAPAQTLPTVTVVAHHGSIVYGVEGGQCGSPSTPLVFVPQQIDDASFTLTLTGEITQSLEVHLSWGGSAIPGIDYHTPPTSVTFNPGTSEITVSAGITAAAGNPIDTGNKTIELTIVEGDGYTVGSEPQTALVAIAVPSLAACPPIPPETNPSFTG